MKPFTLIVVVLSLTTWLAAQEPPASVPATAPPGGAPSSQTSSSSSKQAKDRPVPSFLILGTIFNEKALSFPGVQVRIRTRGEKKYRWETYTNSRGEFAVRVPPGREYEVLVHVKSYVDQTKMVDCKVDVQQRLSVQLEPLGQAKTGAKP